MVLVPNLLKLEFNMFTMNNLPFLIHVLATMLDEIRNDDKYAFTGSIQYIVSGYKALASMRNFAGSTKLDNSDVEAIYLTKCESVIPQILSEVAKDPDLNYGMKSYAKAWAAYKGETDNEMLKLILNN